MGDNSGIEWTDATWYYVSTERRWKVYQRKVTDRPGTTERRRRAARGFHWCRGCQSWLTDDLVIPNQGVCRVHANEEARAYYAADPRAQRQKVHARKRNVQALPTIGIEYLLDQFDGDCAYCPAAADGWDHIVPVSAGGTTTPGNVVPACGPCNSSKRNRDLIEWLEATSRTPRPELWDVLALDAA